MPDPIALHPTDETFAAYLGQAISPVDRTMFEAHVADCARCRALLARAGASLASLPGDRVTRWRRRAPVVAGLAAAGLAALVLLRPPSPRVSSAPAELRAPPPSAQQVQLLAPTAGARVTVGTLRFAWQAPPTAQLYDVSVMAADGSVLWSTQTQDTVATLPHAVARRLSAGSRYFWRVDALLTDMRSTSSGETAFEIVAP